MSLRQRIIETILAYRIRARHPTLVCHHSTLWNYGYRDIDALEIGKNVWIGPYAEILVFRHSPNSSVEGRLILEDEVKISFGADIRAAGGTIRIGKGSGIGQHVVLVAANHLVKPGVPRFNTGWDEERCGIDIGSNVWVGANCVILPGAVIDDEAVIAAGSVVRGTVPAGEMWAGVPAKKIKQL